jgi:hypothetical protein
MFRIVLTAIPTSFCPCNPHHQSACVHLHSHLPTLHPRTPLTHAHACPRRSILATLTINRHVYTSTLTSTPCILAPRSRTHAHAHADPEGSAVLKELLQNADDAGAKTLRVVHDMRQHPTERTLYPGLAGCQGKREQRTYIIHLLLMACTAA